MSYFTKLIIILEDIWVIIGKASSTRYIGFRRQTGCWYRKLEVSSTYAAYHFLNKKNEFFTFIFKKTPISEKNRIHAQVFSPGKGTQILMPIVLLSSKLFFRNGLLSHKTLNINICKSRNLNCFVAGLY